MVELADRLCDALQGLMLLDERHESFAPEAPMRVDVDRLKAVIFSGLVSDLRVVGMRQEITARTVGGEAVKVPECLYPSMELPPVTRFALAVPSMRQAGAARVLRAWRERLTTV